MSGALDPRAIAQQTRKLLKDAGANLGGKRRGHDPVHRHSFDIDSQQANVFRPVGGGTIAGGLGWADDLLRVAKEYDIIHKKKGERSPLMANGIRVLEALLKNFMDFKTGKLDPALTTLQAATALSKNAVVDALKRLKEHGFLNWVRRSEEAETTGVAGPQRKQATNAYFIDTASLGQALGALGKGVRARFLNLREARRRRTAAAPQKAPAPLLNAPEPPKPGDSTMEAALKRIEAVIEARV